MTKITDDMKIVRVVKTAEANPFTPGTKVHKRVAAVLRCKTVDAAKRAGARASTVRYLANAKIIRVAA